MATFALAVATPPKAGYLLMAIAFRFLRRSRSGGATGWNVSPDESFLEADISTVVKWSHLGDTFMFPANVTYTHTNRGQSAARMFVTYNIDKSKAVTKPVR